MPIPQVPQREASASGRMRVNGFARSRNTNGPATPHPRMPIRVACDGENGSHTSPRVHRAAVNRRRDPQHLAGVKAGALVWAFQSLELGRDVVRAALLPKFCLRAGSKTGFKGPLSSLRRKSQGLAMAVGNGLAARPLHAESTQGHVSHPCTSWCPGRTPGSSTGMADAGWTPARLRERGVGRAARGAAADEKSSRPLHAAADWFVSRPGGDRRVRALSLTEGPGVARHHRPRFMRVDLLQLTAPDDAGETPV
jgi:hypothetical protein